MPLNFPFDRFLVVDDSAIDSFITTRVLQKAQLVAQVDTVANGEAALAYMRRCQSARQYPEVVLLDIDMPVISGFDFLEQCSAEGLLNDALVKIIMLTSSIHPKDQQQATTYPITDYLIKPLKLHSLLNALRVPCFGILGF